MNLLRKVEMLDGFHHPVAAPAARCAGFAAPAFSHDEKFKISVNFIIVRGLAVRLPRKA
jgi:hypothetical protein